MHFKSIFLVFLFSIIPSAGVFADQVNQENSSFTPSSVEELFHKIEVLFQKMNLALAEGNFDNALSYALQLEELDNAFSYGLQLGELLGQKKTNLRIRCCLYDVITACLQIKKEYDRTFEYKEKFLNCFVELEEITDSEVIAHVKQFLEKPAKFFKYSLLENAYTGLASFYINIAQSPEDILKAISYEEKLYATLKEEWQKTALQASIVSFCSGYYEAHEKLDSKARHYAELVVNQNDNMIAKVTGYKHLGFLYNNGRGGLPKDEKKAVEYWEKGYQLTKEYMDTEIHEDARKAFAVIRFQTWRELFRSYKNSYFRPKNGRKLNPCYAEKLFNLTKNALSENIFGDEEILESRDILALIMQNNKRDLEKSLYHYDQIFAYAKRKGEDNPYPGFVASIQKTVKEINQFMTFELENTSKQKIIKSETLDKRSSVEAQVTSNNDKQHSCALSLSESKKPLEIQMSDLPEEAQVNLARMGFDLCISNCEGTLANIFVVDNLNNGIPLARDYLAFLQKSNLVTSKFRKKAIQQKFYMTLYKAGQAYLNPDYYGIAHIVKKDQERGVTYLTEVAEQTVAQLCQLKAQAALSQFYLKQKQDKETAQKWYSQAKQLDAGLKEECIEVQEAQDILPGLEQELG